MKCHICGVESPEPHGDFCSAAWPLSDMYQALYYFEHAMWCQENGYQHEAEIYFEDSWSFLFEAAYNGSLL